MSSRPVLGNRPPALVDVSPVDTLSAWLAEHPCALVGAVSPSGAPVAMPDGIVLGDQHQTDDRSLLDLVVPEDTKAVVDAFVSALGRGVGLSRIHMASDPARALLLQYVDLREHYGVLVRLVVAGDRDAADGGIRASSFAPSRPRLGVMLKDEVANIVSIDEAVSLMLGWDESDMVGHANLEFLHPDDHVRAIDNWMSGLLAGQVSNAQTVRLRYLCKDGTWIWPRRPTSGTTRPTAPPWSWRG